MVVAAAAADRGSQWQWRQSVAVAAVAAVAAVVAVAAVAAVAAARAWWVEHGGSRRVQPHVRRVGWEVQLLLQQCEREQHVECAACRRVQQCGRIAQQVQRDAPRLIHSANESRFACANAG